MLRTYPKLMLVLALFGMPAVGCQKAEPKSDTSAPIVLAPGAEVVPGKAVIVIHCNAELIWKSDLYKAVREKMAPLIGKGLEEFEKSAGMLLTDVRSLTLILSDPEAKSPLVIVRTAKPYDAAKLTAALRLKEKELRAVGERTFLVGDASRVKPDLSKPDELSYLTPALREVAQKHQIVLGFRLPAETAAEIRENLPRAFWALDPLFNVKSGLVTLDLGKATEYQAALYFADADKAQDATTAARSAVALARTHLKQARQELGKLPEMAPFLDYLKKADQALAQAKIEQDGQSVRMAMRLDADLVETVALLIPAVQKVREAANRMASQNNLRQIGVAMHNYHSDFIQLPAAAYVRENVKPVSWRVQILPYIEQEALFRQYRFDEPWDSEHNKKLIPLMPKIYAHPAAPTTQPGMTYYQVFDGKEAAFHGSKRITLTDITNGDGSSNSLMVVEAASPVPWTKPADLPYDPDKPLPKLGGQFTGGFSVVFCDGSVRFLKKDIDEKTVRALITIRGGENVRPPED